MSDNRVIPLPDAQYEDEARTDACRHKVYAHLLQLAARKEAAAWGTQGAQTQATAGQIPTGELKAQEVS